MGPWLTIGLGSGEAIKGDFFAGLLAMRHIGYKEFFSARSTRFHRRQRIYSSCMDVELFLQQRLVGVMHQTEQASHINQGLTIL